MDGISGVGGNGSSKGIFPLDGLVRFLPEPKSRLASTFKSVIGTVSSALSESTGAGFGALPNEYVDLINKQIEVQQQMQLVTMYSNIERSKHETEMAAIRNIRTG